MGWVGWQCLVFLGLMGGDGGSLLWAEHRNSSNIKILFRFGFCYGDVQICGRWRSSTTWVGVFHFHGNTIFPETTFSFCRIVFMAHFQVALLSHLPSWAGIDSFSQDFYRRGFYHRVVFCHRIFIIGFFPPWSESQQKLWSGSQILLLLHTQRQKWKDAKKWIKYDIRHFQLSKLILFIRFSSSSGGIFTLTVWKTSYFSLPMSEFPEMMVHLTVPCVAKQADKNHARYLR